MCGSMVDIQSAMAEIRLGKEPIYEPILLVLQDASCIARTTTTLGMKSFAAAGPVIWNSLPSALRTATLNPLTFARKKGSSFSLFFVGRVS